MKKVLSRGLLYLLCLLLFVLNGCNLSDSNHEQITVVFRFDDYSEGRSVEFKSAVINIFSKHGIPFTSAVIPFVEIQDSVSGELVLRPLSIEKSGILIDAINTGIIEIAQHGYNHKNNRHDRRYSEFAGLSYDDQYSRIKKGKDYLEQLLGIKIKSFVPPYNMYDKTTVKVLDELDFEVVSGDILLGETYPGSGLKVIPNTTTLYQFKKAIESAFKSPEKDPLVVCMIHDYDFASINPDKGFTTLEELDKTLEWLKMQKGVRTFTFDELAQFFPNIGMNRYDENKRTANLISKLPPVIKPGYDSYYYGLASYDKYLKILIGFYLLVFCVSMVTAYIFLKILRLKKKKLIVLLASIASIIVAILFYGFQKHLLGHNLIIITVICSGMLLVTLIKIYHKSTYQIPIKSIK